MFVGKKRDSFVPLLSSLSDRSVYTSRSFLYPEKGNKLETERVHINVIEFRS